VTVVVDPPEVTVDVAVVVVVTGAADETPSP